MLSNAKRLVTLVAMLTVPHVTVNAERMVVLSLCEPNRNATDCNREGAAWYTMAGAFGLNITQGQNRTELIPPEIAGHAYLFWETVPRWGFFYYNNASTTRRCLKQDSATEISQVKGTGARWLIEWKEVYCNPDGTVS